MADNKKVVRKFGAFSSSVDPEKLSLAVQGVAGLIVTTLVYFAPSFGISLDGIDFNEVIKNIGGAIVSAGAVLSSLAVVWGGARKLIVALKNRQ